MTSEERLDFQTFIDGLSDKFLQCRADGHGPWRALTATWDGRARIYERKRRCANCGTVKPQTLDDEGYIIGRGGYAYPKGYLATRVELPQMGAQRAAYRLALVQRQLGREPVRRKRRTATTQAA